MNDLPLQSNASPAASTAPMARAEGWSLRRDGWGRLVLVREDGSEVAGVHPVRCFPLTDPERWISLLDSAGHDLLQIEDLNALPESTRALVQAELSEHEFVPKLLRIVHVKGNSPPCEWSVETSRGPTKFLLDSEDHLRKLGPKRILVTDSHGVRYDIPDRDALDSGSKLWLRKFL